MRRMELILLKQYRWWLQAKSGESVEVVVVAKPSNRVEEILGSLPSISRYFNLQRIPIAVR